MRQIRSSAGLSLLLIDSPLAAVMLVQMLYMRDVLGESAKLPRYGCADRMTQCRKSSR